jgi:hypothetical protein
MKRLALAFLAVTLLCQVQVVALDYVWFEAEDYDESNWPDGRSGKGAFAPQGPAMTRLVSKGVWLNQNPGKAGLFLTKKITIVADGEYTFYARCFANWGGGTRSAFRWRLNEQPWITYPQKGGVTMEFVKPTKVSTLAWVRFPEKLKLKKGAYTFRLEMLAPEDAKGFDCFVLATSGFSPNGTLRPGQKLGLADDGMCAFEPDEDAFSPEALLDLRYLNEKVSGENGWMRRSEDGEDFVLGNGEPVRLWSVETNAHVDYATTRKHMRFLAKRGVNAIRVFDTIGPKTAEQSVNDIDEEAREKLWQVVGAARENGIYVLWTPLYFKQWAIYKTWNVKHYQKWNRHREPRHALFTDEEIQEAYRTWMRKVLLPKNPHTGKSLIEDPTLYCIQIQNEDSIFWSGMNWGLTDPGIRLMCKRFGDWLTVKYGSPEKALVAWGAEPLAKEIAAKNHFNADDLAKGEVGLPSTHYPYTSRWNTTDLSLRARGRDALIYMAEYKRSFNGKMREFLQKGLGYKGMVSANNWRTKDQITLDDVERYSYTSCEVIDAHKYVGVLHVNPTEPHKAGYQINRGDLFVDDAVLQNPALLPHNYKMVKGHPNIITESTWVPPRGRHAEGPLVAAAYGGLTGLDCFNWFAFGRGWAKTQGKWSSHIPGILAGFPAAALMYRRGDVKESEPVVYEERPLEHLWDRKFPMIGEAKTYDPNVDNVFAVGNKTHEGGVNPLAYHVGAVRVLYGGDPKNNKVHPQLASYIDEQAQCIKSVTGELTLEYGKGLLLCNTPRSQAVAGFLRRNGGSFTLADVTILSKDDYACVMVTSLDDEPLAKSARVLVQVTTKSRLYGWREEEGTFPYKRNQKTVMLKGKKITSIGSMPWNMKKSAVSVVIRNPNLKTATLLDPNGMRIKKLPVQKDAKGVSLSLPEDALYIVLE